MQIIAFVKPSHKAGSARLQGPTDENLAEFALAIRIYFIFAIFTRPENYASELQGELSVAERSRTKEEA